MWRKAWAALRQHSQSRSIHLIVPLSMALLSGAAAYWAALAYLDGAERRVAQRYATDNEMKSVIVASRAVDAGTQLDSGTLARRLMPVRYIPRSAFAAEVAETLYGRTLARSLDAGEALTPAVLADPRSDELAAQVAPGQRAMTIAVDDTNSHASLVRPGDRVDLVWVHDSASASNATLAARPLLQAVEVLATGKTLRAVRRDGERAGTPEAAMREYTTLTLRVEPTDVAAIAIAERSGELLISLRATDDVRSMSLETVTLAGLLGTRGVARRRSSPGPWQVAGWVGGRGSGNAAQVWTVGAMSGQVQP